MRVNTETKFLERNELLGNQTFPEKVIDKVKLFVDGRKYDSSYEDIKYMKGKAMPKVLSRRIWNGEQYVMRQNYGEANIPAVMTSNNDNIAQGRRNLYIYGSYLDGFLVDNINIVETMLKSNNTIRDKKESILGDECFVIESDSQNGHFILWVDENAGYNIRKAIIKLNSNALYSSKSLSKNAPKGNIKHNIPKLDMVELELKDVKILKIEGNYIPVAGTLIRTNTYDNGKINRVQYTTNREDIQLNPDFDKLGAFVMDGIPNGTRVYNQEMQGIRYIWQDGKAIIDENKEIIEDMNKAINVEIASNKTPSPDKTNATTKNTRATAEEKSSNIAIIQKRNWISNKLFLGILLMLFIVAGVGIYYVYRSRRKFHGNE